MLAPKPLSQPAPLLDRRIRAAASLPALAAHVRPVTARAEPVLRCDRGSRQMSLPFFAPIAARGR